MNARARAPTAGRGWVEGVVAGLIQRAARKAPPSLAERLEEEWLADLAARRGALARLHFALGCCRAMRVIVLDLAAPLRAGAGSSAGKSAALLAEPGPSILSRRATVFVLIGVLHTLVILGLASGMTREVLQAIPPLQVTWVPKAAPRAAPPAPAAPALAHFLPQVPPISRTYDFPADPITVPSAQQGPAALGAVTPRQVTRVAGGPGRGFPDTQDYYPEAARRLGEQGVATVRVCVDVAGRLSAEPVIARSTGSVRLDAGALRLAKAGSGHYQPTTEDGRPVSACYPFAVRFELRY